MKETAPPEKRAAQSSCCPGSGRKGRLMKCAVIDIGSNSMRLTVYDAQKDSFKILFKEKIMTALAGYVEKGKLTQEGIDSACSALMEFRHRLDVLEIRDVYVFATASLRNISNTREAVEKIRKAAGFPIEVVSGEEEAMYGFIGAATDVPLKEGVFVDIGGASTEISVFCGGKMQKAFSFPIGSLKLYRECVKGIVPGRGALRRMEKRIGEEIGDQVFSCSPDGGRIVCIGGTSRAVLKLARRVFSLEEGQNHIRTRQLNELCDLIFKADKESCDLILKSVPERIHTLIPGMMILRYITDRFHASEITISDYSGREGYLCQKIQQNRQTK